MKKKNNGGGQIKFLFGLKKKRLNNGKELSRNYSQGERVHSTDGISPCLSAQMGGTANGSILILVQEEQDEDESER